MPRPRRLSHSRRLLLRARLVRLSRLALPLVVYSYVPSRRGDARPPPSPVRAFSEIEIAYLAGLRTIRAFRWAQRHGGFPEPARRTPQGPVWTAAQIAQWLGDQLAGPVLPDQDDDAISSEEAALLAEIERLSPAAA